ncbi:MAG: transcription termination factor NusA [Alphaproteobacteria bacterium]
MDGITITRTDMLAVADAVAREKAIERELVLEAMEQAIQKAGRSKYGMEHDIRAAIDRKTGEIVLARYIEVVEPEDLEDEVKQMTVDRARRKKADAVVGEFIVDRLPPIDFGRIAAQTAKQVIVQKVREAERERQYEEYKDRAGEIVNGLVKRVEYGNVTVDLGRAEAVMRRDEVIPREHFKRGDRVRAFIYDVRREQKGPQIFLSRTRPEFMAMLFAQEVPEIYDGIIEIRKVARDPGSRAKIAVISNDGSIDPVGACVGMRGSRVQAVVAELQGEKIDIIPWNDEDPTFVVNALAPAEVTKVVMDPDTNTIEVVVPDEQLSLAIGRRGQNVRLASMLTGWNIDIMTEEQESEKRQREFMERSELFMEALDVDDMIAQLLVTEGFTSVEEVAYVPIEELAAIEGFDADVAEALSERANNHLEALNQALAQRRLELGVKDDLVEFTGFSNKLLIKLGEGEVRTLEDLAGLAADELTDPEDGILKGEGMTEEEATQLVMSARVQVGWITQEELDAMMAEPSEDGEEEAEGAA